MRFLEKLSSQHLGKDVVLQTQSGLKKLTDEQLRQVQGISLEIYKDILTVCDQNDIAVMASGGTAIGTVRHKGFIPWDDDMDLMMMRKDYDRFMEVFDKSPLSEKYTLDLKSNLPSLFVRVDKRGTKMTGVFNNPKYPERGIGIDIFPIDSVPDNVIARYTKGIFSIVFSFVIISRKMFLCRNPMAKRYYCQSFGMRLFYCIRMVIGFLAGFVPYKTLCRCFDKFVASAKKTRQVTIASGRGHYFGEMLPTNVFVPTRLMEFEGLKIYMPNDYDKYLTNLYGDYMKIPPEDKREYHAFVDFGIDH